MKRLILILVITLTAITLTGCMDEKEYSYTSQEVEDLFVRKKIKSLGLNDNQEGSIVGSMRGSMSSFSLGYGYGSGYTRGSVRGNMEEVTYYYVYVEEQKDKYLLQKFDATATYISESNEQPYLEQKVRTIVVDREALNGKSYNFKVDERMVSPRSLLNLSSGFYVGEQLYNEVNIDLLEKNSRDQLIEIFPELNDENKVLLISIGDETTLYVPKGTIVTEYNADVQNVN